MNRLNVVCIFIFLALAINIPVSAQSMIIVEIPAEVTVTGPSIQLIELGTISGASAADLNLLKEIKLGTAPLPGQTKIISRDYLKFLLKQYRFEDLVQLKMASNVQVKVASSCITDQEITAKINQILPPLDPVIKKRWIELNRLPEKIWLPKSDWQIKTEVMGQLPEMGLVLFKVVISNGEECRILNVSGKIKATALVYRVKNKIPARSSLKAEDFEEVELELKTGKEYLGPFLKDIRSTTLLKPGSILQKEQFEMVPLVNKNTPVTVIVKSGNVEIKLTAQAQQDGWLGDQVVLMNLVSKKTFKGKVIGANTLEVVLP